MVSLRELSISPKWDNESREEKERERMEELRASAVRREKSELLVERCASLESRSDYCYVEIRSAGVILFVSNSHHVAPCLRMTLSTMSHFLEGIFLLYKCDVGSLRGINSLKEQRYVCIWFDQNENE